MKSKIKLICLSIFGLFITPFVTKAVCPVCTVAIASGVGLCRYLGIDDLISGLWVGGLLISLAVWTKDYLKKHKWDFKYSYPILSAGYFLITFIPLKFLGILGHKYNLIFGMDRLLFSSIAGAFLVHISVFINNWLKKQNHNKVFIPYQKVIIPLILLTIFSFVFYYLFC